MAINCNVPKIALKTPKAPTFKPKVTTKKSGPSFFSKVQTTTASKMTKILNFVNRVKKVKDSVKLPTCVAKISKTVSSLPVSPPTAL